MYHDMTHLKRSRIGSVSHSGERGARTPLLIKGKRELAARCQCQRRGPARSSEGLACSRCAAVVPRLVQRDLPCLGANSDIRFLPSVLPEGRTKPGHRLIGRLRRHQTADISFRSSVSQGGRVWHIALPFVSSAFTWAMLSAVLGSFAFIGTWAEWGLG